MPPYPTTGSRSPRIAPPCWNPYMLELRELRLRRGADGPVRPCESHHFPRRQDRHCRAQRLRQVEPAGVAARRPRRRCRRLLGSGQAQLRLGVAGAAAHRSHGARIRAQRRRAPHGHRGRARESSRRRRRHAGSPPARRLRARRRLHRGRARRGTRRRTRIRAGRHRSAGQDTVGWVADARQHGARADVARRRAHARRAD